MIARPSSWPCRAVCAKRCARKLRRHKDGQSCRFLRPLPRHGSRPPACAVRRTMSRDAAVHTSAQSRQTRMHWRMSIRSATHASAQDVQNREHSIACRAALAKFLVQGAAHIRVQRNHFFKRHGGFFDPRYGRRRLSFAARGRPSRPACGRALYYGSCGLRDIHCPLAACFACSAL